MNVRTYDADRLKDLQDEWANLLTEFGADADVSERLFQQVAAQYLGEARHYHTLDHIYDTLDFAKTLANYYQISTTEKTVLQLAVWFHDVVYDTHAADNEEKSAEYAQAILQVLELPDALIERVKNLIISTKTHQVLSLNDVTNSILLDADLSILGATPIHYAAYALAIRKEYGWVSEAEFKIKRKAVLEKFLERPRLYFTAYAFERLQAGARLNLQREIATLEIG